ncbi:hypothetical protein Ddc_13600 [Ditylenchus destructor]|nr:hypothetical protein Ddc_13600 [Ditylenchus destructor]
MKGTSKMPKGIQELKSMLLSSTVILLLPSLIAQSAGARPFFPENVRHYSEFPAEGLNPDYAVRAPNLKVWKQPTSDLLCVQREIKRSQQKNSQFLLCQPRDSIENGGGDLGADVMSTLGDQYDVADFPQVMPTGNAAIRLKPEMFKTNQKMSIAQLLGKQKFVLQAPERPIPLDYSNRATSRIPTKRSTTYDFIRFGKRFPNPPMDSEDGRWKKEDKKANTYDYIRFGK